MMSKTMSMRAVSQEEALRSTLNPTFIALHFWSHLPGETWTSCLNLGSSSF